MAISTHNLRTLMLRYCPNVMDGIAITDQSPDIEFFHNINPSRFNDYEFSHIVVMVIKNIFSYKTDLEAKLFDLGRTKKSVEETVRLTALHNDAEARIAYLVDDIRSSDRAILQSLQLIYRIIAQAVLPMSYIQSLGGDIAGIISAPLPPLLLTNVCAQCGIRDVKLKKCSFCTAVRYCSKACQSVHWYAGGHRELCVRHDLSDAIPHETKNERSSSLTGPAEA